MKTMEERAREALLRRRDSIAQALAVNRIGEAELMKGLQPSGEVERRETAEVIDRLIRREVRELAEIEAALARLERGGYGTCAECGRPIGRQRLVALPEAPHCERCARKSASEEAR